MGLKNVLHLNFMMLDLAQPQFIPYNVKDKTERKPCFHFILNTFSATRRARHLLTRNDIMAF
jgi:hypothetical protein